MTRRLIDQHAVRIPQRSGLLPCLYVPIAARDTQAIEMYVGRIVERLSRGPEEKALLVESHEPEPPDDRLAIWAHPEAAVLHYPRQVWVHVDYTAYRRVAKRAIRLICSSPLRLVQQGPQQDDQAHDDGRRDRAHGEISLASRRDSRLKVPAATCHMLYC